MSTRPPTQVALTWTQDLAFTARAGAHEIVIDGNGTAGLTPVQLLGISLAGCMGTDVALILTRGRQPFTALQVTLEAERAAEEPRRFVRVRIHFAVAGEVTSAPLERAIALSREKYCSVWHTLRPELPLDITSAITPL